MVAKKETTIDDLSNLIGDFIEMVAAEFVVVNRKFDGIDKRFDGIDKRFDGIDKRFDSLEKSTNNGFLKVNERLEALEADSTVLKREIVFVKDILEAHTKFLKDLDQERIFSVHRTDRIEKDVQALKKSLKIA